MDKIDEIINKYAVLFDDSYRKQIDIDVKNIIPELKENFIQFYGEERRNFINDKFSRLQVIVPPINLYSLYRRLRGEIEEYLNIEFNTGFYEGYFDSFTIDDDINFYDEDVVNKIIEIRKKILCYKQLADKYYELKEKVNDEVEIESIRGIINYVKDILSNNSNCSKDIINKIDINNINDVILAINVFLESFDDDFELSNLDRCLETFRSIGINIPRLSYENGDYLNQDDDLAKFHEFILRDVNKGYLTIDVAKKIQLEIEYIENIISDIVESRTAKIYYNDNSNDLDFLGFLGIMPANFNFYGSFEPYLVKKDSKIDIGGVVYLNPYVDLKVDYVKTLIHEINHYLETFKISNTDYGTYIYNSGWDIVEKDEKHLLLPSKERYRNYELLNEVINEFISFEIYKNGQKNMIYRDFSNGKIYYSASFILEEFYQTYKEQILESRLTGNFEILYDKVGQKNLDDIAKLLFDFSKYAYDGFDYDKVVEMFNNGINNEEVAFYLEVCQERDRILNNMKNYGDVMRKGRGSINLFGIIFLLIFMLIFVFFII